MNARRHRAATRTPVLFIVMSLAFGRGTALAEERGADAPAPEASVVTLTKEALANATIRTESARRGDLRKRLRVPGRISANQNRTARVLSTLEGRIIRLNFDIGDAVRAGDVMGLVETPELVGKPLELRSPIAGRVVERNRAMGELVDRGSDVYVVSDSSRVWVIGEVRERDVGLVASGQEITFRVVPYPDEIFHGTIARVGGEIEAASRTLEIRAEIENARGVLKPGMFADLEITTTVVPNVLLVSDRALQTEERDQVLFVALGPDRFERRVVRVGEEQENEVQILDGVREGETVVTDGSFILKSEMLKGELGEE